MRKTKDITLIAVLSGLVLLLALIPGLGYIPIGPIRATTIHIPVIIASLLFGPKKGAALGFVFGLTSLINNTFNPTPTSFVFSPFYADGNLLSLVICFVPRILIGVVPYYTYKLLKKINETFSMALASFLGSITNTILVMNMIYFFFKKEYSSAIDKNPEVLYDVILGIISLNGVIEAIAATIIATIVTKTLKKQVGV